VGFELAPIQFGVSLKSSGQNFLEPAYCRRAWATKKSSGTPVKPPDRWCTKQQRSFSKLPSG